MSIVVKAERENQEKTNGKPVMLAPIYGNIPQEMRERRQWINWKLSRNPKPTGKQWTKIPLDPKTRHKAATTRDITWADFDPACQRYEQYAAQEGKGQCEGIGYILRGDHVGIDLDDCRDPQTGEIDQQALDIIRRIDSYTEVSPSGTGIRIICRGKLPPGARRKGTVEMYDESSPRYLTITGHVLDGRSDIHDRQAEIEAVHAEYLGTETTEETKPTPACDVPEDLDTDQVLEKASTARNGERFSKLWRGEWQGDYESQSEADLALAGDLAFWCGPDPDRIDAMFRQSGLYRDKCNRIGADTIRKAMRREDFYDWGCLEYERINEIVTGGYVPQPTGNGQATEDFAREIGKELEERERKEKRNARRRAWTLEEWEQQPGVEWIVRDILPKQSIVFLVGPSGHGKSFITLDIGLSVASGLKWLDQWECKQGNVFYAVAEGQAGLRKRWRAWSQYHKVALPTGFRLLPNPYWIQRPDEVEELRRSIDETGLKPDLIVLDTFNQMFVGNEKEGADVRAFMAALNQLRLDYACSVMPLHHTGWSENRRERGHSSMRGDADVTWITYKPGGDDAPDYQGHRHGEPEDAGRGKPPAVHGLFQAGRRREGRCAGPDPCPALR